MRTVFKGALLAFSLMFLAVISLLISDAIAKPVGPNPETWWPDNTVWGTKLRLENGIYIGEAWFGAKAGGTIKTPAMGGLLGLDFVGGPPFLVYFQWVENSLIYGTPPQSFSWYVRFYGNGNETPTAGVVSIVLENADTFFVPHDFSVVLDNSAQGIFVNLRNENKLITDLPKYATLYVDNAVNIQSIENLDPLIGKVGDNLRLRVTVKNTGMYTDNYAVSAGRGLDPTIPNLAPDSTDNVIVTTTYPSGIENIVVTAAGNYATDQDYITVTGISGPFLINGNDNFTPANGVSSGSGTENDPYIIENWDVSVENANGVDVENTTAYFVIRNCYVHDGGEIVGENWVMPLPGIYLDNVVNGKIEKCKIDNSVFGVILHASFNTTITSNMWDNNDHSIALYESSSDFLTNNKFSNDHISIDLQRCENDIVDNNVSENGHSGIRLYFSFYNALTNNSNFGIGLIHSSNNTITNNTFNNNQWGISFYFSDNNTLTNNEVDNNYYGIEFDFSDNNTVTNNTCENNWQSILLWGSYENFILHNNNNLIYHNNFINDTTLAYDDGTNYWDNGYPSGGNYWSDYSGADDFKGENQNIPGGEGIGDTPYLISGGTNQDLYPLMYPWPCNIENHIIHLFAGWNLVGFVTENTPNNIFTGLTQPDNYLMYYWNAPGGPYGMQGSNTVCRDNVGYWVFIDQNRWVGTSDMRPASRDIHFAAGWNLVSFPIVDENTTPNNIFAPLVYNTDYIMYFWNAPGGPYGLQGQDQPLIDNTGYWVWIDRDWTATVGSAPPSNLDILASSTPNSIDVNVYYTIKVEVLDNDNLLDVNEVWLKLYENSLSQGAPDNVQNHYTFRWVRGAGFSEVGPGALNEDMNIGPCSPGSDSATTDNWTFRIKLDVIAEPGSWNLWAKVVDNKSQQDNQEFANEFTVNPYAPVPSLIVDSGLPFFANELVKDNVPVAQPDGVGFDSYSVYNPAVAYRDNKFYMFYRAQQSFGGVSKIGIATSDNGHNFQNRPNPVISNTQWYESLGVEDPRVVKIENTYWMTYTGWDGGTARLALASSEDLENWTKRGLMFSDNTLWNKSGAILPEKINGKYYMYYEGAPGGGDLYYATSENLFTWTSRGVVMQRRNGYFDALTIESGPQPIILENGILVIYNSLDKQLGDGGTLATGWVIFARDDPTKIIARCEEPFLVPELSWEKNGQTPNIVFAEGLVEVNNTWFLYYGAADTVVGLATAPIRSALWSVETPAEWEDGTFDNIIIPQFQSGIAIGTNMLVRGWWRLNENTGSVAHDSSGFDANGTIQGASWTTGKSGSALEFLRSDSNDRVDVGDLSNLEGFSGLTISAWIKPYSKSHNGEIVKKNGVYLLRVNESLDDNVAFMVWDSNGVKHVLQVPDNYFPNNQWTMITATWDGSKMRIYKNDAILIGEQEAFFERLATTTDSFCIGNQPSGGEGFDGSIDEVTVFDGSITENEIRYLYNNTDPSGIVQSGEWRSAWHALGVPVIPKDLKVFALKGSSENVRVTIEGSKDGSSVEDNLGRSIENGSNSIDLSALPDAQYIRVKFRLETDDLRHSPRVGRFTLDGRQLHIMVSSDSASSAGDNNVTLKGTLINLENEETQAWFMWRENGATSWSETGKRTVSVRTQFSDNISGLTENVAYEFRAAVKDLNSGENTTGSILIFIMDRTPPSIFGLLSPPNNAVLPENMPATLKWQASADYESGLSHYEVWLNGINVDNVVENQYTTAPLPQDNYLWYVVAVDRLGNVRVSTNTFAFTTGIPPEPFELISPQGSYTLDNTVVLSWDNSSGRVTSLDKYEVWIDGVKVDEVPADLTYYLTSELLQGSHQWYVVAVDQVGNYRQSDNVFTFTVGAPLPYPMRDYFDGFENNNLNGYVSYGMGIADNALYGAHSLDWTGPGEGYAYVSNVRLLNFEGAASVIFRLDDLSSKPGVGFASDDGTMVYALVDVNQGWLRVERRGYDSAYGTVPIDYRLTKSPFISFNWGTETHEDNFYTLDVERFGISGINVNTSYRLTLYFSTRSMTAMAFLEDLNGSVLSQVRATVDITPDHPLLLSDGPARFDNFSFDVIDNWLYNWEPGLQPVLSPTPGAWDAAGAFNPTVGIWDNEFRMFYRGNANPQPPAGPPSSSIGYAKSPDGYNWTKYPTPVLQRFVDGGQSLEDPLLLINPFGDNVQYLAYTDYNGFSTPSKMRSFKFDTDGSILWENGPWTINWENKIAAIVDTAASPWGHSVLYNGTSYRFFSIVEPSSSMGFSNDLLNWVWRYGSTIGGSDNTWSNNPDSTIAEIPSGAMFMPDGNILVATCMTTDYGYVGGTQATLGTAIFSGTQPWVLLERATLPWAPDYYGDVDTAAADLTKDNRSWYDGPNFPGKSFVLTSDNWLYFYYGGNDQYTGVARTRLAPKFEYRGLMLSKGIVDPNEPFVASVVVRNVGNLDGQENVKLYLNGALENSEIVDLGRNNETTVQFTVTINEGGVFAIQAGDMSSTVWVV